MKRLIAFLLLLASTAFAAGGIQTWSPTPAENNNPPPYGYRTNMLATQVATTGQQVMADVRTWYDGAQWVDDGIAKAYVSPTAFSVLGDYTSTYQVNRRVQVSSTTPATIYGTIVSSTYSSPSTTVVINPDSGTLDTNLSRVWYGAVSALNSSVTSSTIGLGDIGIPSAIENGTTGATANAASISLTVAGTTVSYAYSQGLVTTGLSSSDVISASGIFSSGDVSATGRSITAGSVSASIFNVGAVTAGAISASSMTLSNTTLGDCKGLTSYVEFFGLNTGSNLPRPRSCNATNVNRLSLGRYAISGTFPSGNYTPICSCGPRSGGADQLWAYGDATSPTTTGYIMNFRGTGGNGDCGNAACMVW